MWILFVSILTVLTYLCIKDFNSFKKVSHCKITEIPDFPGFSFNSEPVFDDGKSKGFFNFSNHSNHAVIIEIHDESSAVVYTSKTIKPGESVRVDKLLIELPKGLYKCKGLIYTIDESTGSCIFAAETEMTIQILKQY